MKSTRPFALSAAKGLMTALALAALACSAAVSAQLPLADAAALHSIGRANLQTAQALELATCASERSAVAASASGCTDTVCRVSIAAIAALTPCAAQRAAGIVQAQAAPPAPQIINAAPPPTAGERIVGLFAGTVGKLFDFAIANGPSYLNYRLGTVQSNNQTALGIAQSANALAAQQSSNGMVAGMAANIAGTAGAGFTALQGTAAAGFASNGLISGQGFAAATAFGNNLQGLGATAFNAFGASNTAAVNALTLVGSRPTSVVNVAGNGNAINGSTADNRTTTTTSTNNCPGASGGNGAPSGSTGNTGAGGNGTVSTGPGTGTATGATSGTAGTTGAGGAGTAGAVGCSVTTDHSK